MRRLLADGVAGAVPASVGRRSPIELILAAFAVRSVGVLATVGAVSAVARQLVHLLVEVAPVRQAVAAAR